MKYIVKATSSYKNRENKIFNLHVFTTEELSTDTHIHVAYCNKDGLYGMRYFRDGLKLIKSNKQGKYFEISNAPIFTKTRIYIKEN